ncbi:MAG: glycerol kinase GlpK [Clostridia bacterium]|nr:glycerol kinase GlpK [Clostridia bacterium]
MQKNRYILTIDAGTTSVRTLLYDTMIDQIVNIHSARIEQYYPNPGWVDQDAREIWKKIHNCLVKTIGNINEDEIVGLGITNQRETVVMWDKDTGEPIAPAISWQDSRTQRVCEKLENDGPTCQLIYNKTGLIPNCYFSASSIHWLLTNCYDVKVKLKQGKLCCGTIDSYLVYRLTNGKSFVTDASNASRTMLYNITTNDWDNELLDLFQVPRDILPDVVDSTQYVGDTVINGKVIKIGGILGDQQASLFGQACYDKGNAKNTYGTGSFLLMNIGTKPKFVNGTKTLTTIAWRINGKTTYALEGSVFNAGSCVTWLHENMGLVSSPANSTEVAMSVQDSDGVYFVPALSGLGAPFWDSNARGTITGMTLGTTKAHVVRAVLEGVCYSVRAVLDKMESDAGVRIKGLRVDGGMTRNPLVMQTQSDTLQDEVILSKETESTALGAVFACGLCFGRFEDYDELRARYKIGRIFTPSITRKVAGAKYQGWLDAVDRARSKK